MESIVGAIFYQYPEDRHFIRSHVDMVKHSASGQSARLSAEVFDRLFLTSRTHNAWMDKPLSDELMRELYDLAKWGPTAANSTPARFVFVRSAAAKQRLRPHLMPLNVDKTLAASCCVIVAYDTCFHDLMAKLFPSRDMRSSF